MIISKEGVSPYCGCDIVSFCCGKEGESSYISSLKFGC